MTTAAAWLFDLETAIAARAVDGLIPVLGYGRSGRPPEEVAVIEKAATFGAHAVFFEASRNDRAPIAQACSRSRSGR